MGAGYKSNDLLLLVFLATPRDVGGEGGRPRTPGRRGWEAEPARSSDGRAGSVGSGG